MSQLLSEEHYRLCLSIYIHNMQTFTICHCAVVDGTLYFLPQQKRSAAGNYTSAFKSLKKHSILRFARFHISLVNRHPCYYKLQDQKCG